MNRTNNLLLAAALPLFYGAYKYYSDKNFQTKIDDTFNRGADYLSRNANKLVGKVETTGDSVKDFFKENYDQLNLSDNQVKKIKKVLTTRLDEATTEVKSILSEDQLQIFDKAR